ncbi:MAG: DUF5329 domain-containing protein [Rubrivivax sp.]
MRRRRVVCTLLLTGLLGTLSAVQAATAPEVRAEVDRLLSRLRSAGCRFNRNGSWYSGDDAVQHLSRKRAYLEDKGALQSTEDFIQQAASQSSVSGRPYLVQCGDAAPVQAGSWLREQLAAMRKAR